jgi:hypothetical protein
MSIPDNIILPELPEAGREDLAAARGSKMGGRDRVQTISESNYCYCWVRTKVRDERTWEHRA